jgi:hypothetical protein
MLFIHLELFIGKELSSQVSLCRNQVILRGFGILRLEVILWLLDIL